MKYLSTRSGDGLSRMNGWLLSLEFSVNAILAATLVGIFFSAISDVPQSWGAAFWLARVVVTAILILSVIVPRSLGVLLFFLLLLAGRDFSPEPVASVWRLELGPINPSWIVFGLLAIHLFRFRRWVTTPTTVLVAIVWFATVPVVAGLVYGGLLHSAAIEQAPIDLKVPMMLFGVLLLFLGVMRSESRLPKILIVALIGGLIARHSVDLVYLFFDLGPELDAGINRVSEDSAKSAVVLIIFICLAIVAFRPKWWWGAGVGLIPTATLTIVYATRMIWVVVPVSLVLMVLAVGLRRSALVAAVLFLMTVLGGVSLGLVRPTTLDLVVARAKTITEGRPESKFRVDVDYNVISRIDPVRYAEAINIFDTHQQRQSHLWGSGYAGYFLDDAVHLPDTLGTSYPEHSFETGRFYRPHMYSLTMYHKYGLMGLTLLSLVYVIPTIRLVKGIRQKVTEPSSERIVLIALVAFMPMVMIQLYWAGKALFLSGVLLALCFYYAGRLRDLKVD